MVTCTIKRKKNILNANSCHLFQKKTIQSSWIQKADCFEIGLSNLFQTVYKKQCIYFLLGDSAHGDQLKAWDCSYSARGTENLWYLKVKNKTVSKHLFHRKHFWFLIFFFLHKHCNIIECWVLRQQLVSINHKSINGMINVKQKIKIFF